MTERSFTTGQIVRMARITPRQLQWWDERKVVQPDHSGWIRSYTADQALLLLVVAELRRKGLSLQKVRRILRALKKETEGRDILLHLAETQLCLVTDGRSIEFADQGKLLPLLAKARRAVHVVSISDQARRIQPLYELTQKAS